MNNGSGHNELHEKITGSKTGVWSMVASLIAALGIGGTGYFNNMEDHDQIVRYGVRLERLVEVTEDLELLENDVSTIKGILQGAGLTFIGEDNIIYSGGREYIGSIEDSGTFLWMMNGIEELGCTHGVRNVWWSGDEKNLNYRRTKKLRSKVKQRVQQSLPQPKIPLEDVYPRVVMDTSGYIWINYNENAARLYLAGRGDRTANDWILVGCPTPKKDTT